MRIIHTADWHLGKNLEGHSRLPEQERFLNDFIDICNKEDADLILIAGDIYDNYNPPAYAEQLFYDTLKKLSCEGKRMTIIISGNHDNPDRLTASGPLARDHGIVMVGNSNTLIPEGLYGTNEITKSAPGYIQVSIQNEKADILLLPFPSEKRLGELLYDETDSEEEKAKSYGDKIKLLFDRLEAHYEKDSIHLIMSHLFVMNSIEDGSERSIQLGGSYLVGGDVFPESADYIALGHVHKPQTVPSCPKARYSGSPIHFNIRENAFQKQVLLIEAHPKQDCEIHSIPVPVYKPIELWKCNTPEEAIEKCKEEKDRECFVYLEIRTDHYIHEDQIKEMKEYKDDILSITPIVEDDEKEPLEFDQQRDVPFDDLVKDFYERRYGTSISEDTLQLLLSIISGS